jgi:hypothetical protein
MDGVNVGIGRLPNLIVAGVPKAGTGSLFAYLTQHPEICGADEKEVGYFNFFNPQRHSGEPPPTESYAKHFSQCGDQRYAVEATPTYSYGGAPVIQAVQQVLGRPKIIISLRNPVDRLWSAYTFQRTLGNIIGLQSFEEYLRACASRAPDGSDLVPRDHLHGLYIGQYERYIGLWLDAFGEDLRIVFAEDLARDPERVFADLLRWLGLDPGAVALDLAPRNTTKHARSPRFAKAVYSLKRSTDNLGLLPSRVRRPVRRLYERINAGKFSESLDPDTRRHVAEIYRPSNEATARALTSHGYHDLPDWLTVTEAP